MQFYQQYKLMSFIEYKSSSPDMGMLEIAPAALECRFPNPESLDSPNKTVALGGNN